MNYISHLSKKTKIVGVALILVVLAGYWYSERLSGGSSAAATTSIVIQKVATGTVTNGIAATGKIEAREVLDLNVYKLVNRIDTVAAVNGTHVEQGTLLYAFDSSDADVNISKSHLAVRSAELSLAQEEQTAQDPNTTARTLANDIASLESDITLSEKDLDDALRTYLSANLTAEPTAERYNDEKQRTAPTVGGQYTGTEQGSYLIEVYASGEDSGYSFRYSGLESGIAPVYFGASVPLGTRGLTITFPTAPLQVRSQDAWIVAVPNIYATQYVSNKDTYTETVTNLKNTIATNKVTIANKKTTLAQTLRGDTSADRNLDVENARLAIDQAKVSLSQNITTRDERRIVAPFSGTISGVQNAVVGATPAKDGSDSIDLGSLISDDFVATFSLGAADVAKVSVGQDVLVTLSSEPNSQQLHASVIEVSSLPDSSTVPQYSVRALLEVPDDRAAQLRDGMLANIEIVQEQRDGVVRVAVSALSYQDGHAYVSVLTAPTSEEKAVLDTRGVVTRTSSSQGISQLPVTVGLRGSYYAEITDGLKEDDYVVITKTAASGTTDQSVVQSQRSFGSGPRTSSGGSSGSTSGGDSR